MLRVLVVSDHAPGPTGGVEMHLTRLVRALRAGGHHVATFAGEVTHTGLGRALDVWDPGARRALRRRAAQVRPDVVHIHAFQRELSASVLGALDAPTVLTVHDHRLFVAREGAPDARHGLRTAGKAAKNVLDRWAVRRHVDVVVAVSEELAALLRRGGMSPVRMVPNFADPPGDLGPPGDVVAFAGRLSPEKGLGVLLEAFGAVADRHPNTTLVLAGDGPERSRLEALARRSAPGRVCLPGLLDEEGVRDMLRAARLVCIPVLNPREGLPGALIEAMLAGRPVVASDAPAFRQLVRPGVDGLLVPPGDPVALAAALDRLLGDRDQAAAMGRAGRERAEATAGTAVAVEQLVAVYREAIAAHG